MKYPFETPDGPRQEWLFCPVVTCLEPLPHFYHVLHHIDAVLSALGESYE